MLVVALFLAATGIVCGIWWGRLQPSWHLFRDYWVRDSKFVGFFFPVILQTWGANTWAILVLGVFEGASMGVGQRALGWVFRVPPAGLWRTLLALAIGNGVLGTAVLGMGFLGLTRAAIIWPLAVAALMDGMPAFLRRRARPLSNPPRWGLVDTVLLCFCAFFAAYNLLSAFLPEWFYDCLVYHLGLPSRWLVDGRIHYLPDNFISHYPLLQEMQYMGLMAMGSDISPRLLHWFNGIQGMGLSFLMGSALIGMTGGMLAAAIYISQPIMAFLMHVSMVELGLGIQAGLAVPCFMVALGILPHPGGMKRGPALAWLFAGAWLLGLGHGTKYLGVFVSLILVSLLVLAWRKRGPLAVRGTAIVVAWASVWTLPWLARNYLLTSNPVFPMLYQLFPPADWNPELYSRWMHDNTKYGTGHGSLLNWFGMPVNASAGANEFGAFTMNPVFILFIPLLLLVRTVPAPVVFLVRFALLYGVFWSFSSQQTRFLMPAVPAASVAAAWVVLEAGGRKAPVRKAFILVLSGIFLLSMFGEVQNRFSSTGLVPYASGWADRLKLLRMGIPYFEAVEVANRVMPGGGRLLFVGGDESYYAERPVICSSAYDRCAAGEMAKRADNAAELLRLFKRNRITHMLVCEARAEEYAGTGMFDWGDKARQVFLDFWRSHGRLVTAAHRVFLYEIVDKPLPAGDRKRGVPLYFCPPETIARVRELVAGIESLNSINKFAQSLVLAGELVKLVPGYAHGYAFRAFAYASMGRKREAIRGYYEAINMGYPFASAYYNLGLLLEGEKRRGEALEIYLQGLEIDRTIRGMLARASEMAFVLGQSALALRLTEGLNTAFPGNPAVVARLEELRLTLGARQ